MSGQTPTDTHESSSQAETPVPATPEAMASWEKVEEKYTKLYRDV